MRAQEFTRRALLSILMVLPLFFASPRAEAGEYDKFGGWFIVYVDAGSSNSCSAFTTLTDHTVIQLALVQTPSQMSWAMFLSNDTWKSMFAARSQVTLSLLTSKSWVSTFSVSASAAGDTPVLVSLVPATLIKSVAATQALFILDDKNEPLTGSFDLSDSRRAVEAVERCARERPLTASPRAAPSG
jgi:hypothetical protein